MLVYIQSQRKPLHCQSFPLYEIKTSGYNIEKLSLKKKTQETIDSG